MPQILTNRQFSPSLSTSKNRQNVPVLILPRQRGNPLFFLTRRNGEKSPFYLVETGENITKGRQSHFRALTAHFFVKKRKTRHHVCVERGFGQVFPPF